MKSKVLERNGSFADSDLADDVDIRVAYMSENLVALAEEGLTVLMVGALRDDCLAFRQLPSEITLSNLVSTAVVTRDAALEAARTGLRTAARPIRRAFGDESPEYRSFSVGEVSHKTVSQVETLLLTVPTIGLPFLTNAKAIAEGFNAGRLNALADLYTALFNAEAAVKTAETVALKGTRARVLAYNALNTTCSLYCAKGYDHFVEIDETLAQLFVRHPASHSSSNDTPPTPPEE